MVLKILDKNTSNLLGRVGQNDIQRLRIGTSPECEVQVDDLAVDDVHTVLSKEQGVWYVYDNRSVSGTYLNSEQIRKRAIKSWDELRIGNTVLIVLDTAKMSVGTDQRRPQGLPKDRPIRPTKQAAEKNRLHRSGPISVPFLHFVVGTVGLMCFWLYKWWIVMDDSKLPAFALLGVLTIALLLQARQLRYIKASMKWLIFPIFVVCLLPLAMFSQSFDLIFLNISDSFLVFVFYFAWVAMLLSGIIRYFKSN